jgi:NADH:ubiquinone oxidoreductase subunit 6 (subunit J)
MTITFSIISYALLSFGSFKAFEWSQKMGTKVTVFINAVLFMACMAMTFYLIKNYNDMLSLPLNKKLNDMESIMKVILAVYLLSFNLKKRDD